MQGRDKATRFYFRLKQPPPSSDMQSTSPIAPRKLRPSKLKWRTKRKRTKEAKRRQMDPDGESTIQKLDLFSNLPLEVLSETLCWATTKDVLAVTRCSQRLCRTLLNFPSTDFIWRQARQNYAHQPIPDPLPNFTEGSYAAFIFDIGNCDVYSACDNLIAGSLTLL